MLTSGLDPRGIGYKSQGEQRASSILVPPPPHPLPGQARCRLLPPRATHASTYYSLSCVRRVGRQIRGTLRLPESGGGEGGEGEWVGGVSPSLWEGLPPLRPIPAKSHSASVPHGPNAFSLLPRVEDSESNSRVPGRVVDTKPTDVFHSISSLTF